MNIIDCHSHILPGIDDGSKSWEMTQQMLTEAQRGGVRILIATPHFYADRMRMEDFLVKRKRVFVPCYQEAKKRNILLLGGAEVAFFSGISKAEGIEKLCISGTDLMMVEMPFREWETKDLKELADLKKRGITPIIAHLERFYSYQKDESLIEKLFDLPVYIQLNTGCFLNWKTRKRGFELLDEDNVDFLGSDCHNVTTRPENMGECCDVIEKKFGTEFLEDLERHGADIIRQHRVS